MNELSEVIGRRRLEAVDPSPNRELLLHALSDLPLPEERRIFTNRTLRLEKIRHVGFDLDWTLANYRQDVVSQLAFELTLDRLVERYDYPPAIREAEFRSDFCRRGVLLDTEVGTVLKMNRHRYVGRAYHGRRFLGRKERSRLYRKEPINLAHKRYYFVDTLFELPEVNIYSELVDLAERRPEALTLPSYARLFQDVRQAIDSIHADDTLKRKVLDEPDRYLDRDPQLALALRRLALGGRRFLLITNSEWYYTDGLCRYLFEGALPGLHSWRELFDLVVVDARKPGFFRKNLPFVELDENGREGAEVTVPRWGRVYSGGCRENLMQLLGGLGEEVLYVGDHVYGDVLSSKLASTWRTALVVSELEEELATRARLSAQQRHLEVLRAELADSGQRMDDLDDVLALYRSLAPALNGDAPLTPEKDASLRQIQERLRELRDEHGAMRHHARRLQEQISEAINPYWGSIFKQGTNKSLFGSQVDDFACLYTSRVSNFAYYGSNHYFRVLVDSMMHETTI